MGETLESNIKDAICSGIRLTVGSKEAAERISREAVSLHRSAYVHYKVDTGLHRIGFEANQAAEKIAACGHLEGLISEGLYTHLALRTPDSDVRQH